MNPSNLTDAATGVVGRRGNVILVGSEAAAPLVAFKRMLSVTSARAVAAGIRFAMFSGFLVMAVHFVPFVLYSMRFDTPVTVSVRVSNAMPSGDVVAAFGTATFLMLDDGAVAVALVRIITVAAASQNKLRGRFDAVTSVQAAPLLRLYSIALETPVILSVEPLYIAFGAALRDGTVTERTADANVVSVALSRTCTRWEDVPTFTGILPPAGTAVKTPDVPVLNSIESAAAIDSVNPSNLTDAATGVAGRRGRIMLVGCDAAAPLVAFRRMLRVTSLRAVAAGIRLAMFSGFLVMAVHLVPLVLYSIRFDTPVTVSLCVSNTIPDGELDAEAICIMPINMTQTHNAADKIYFFKNVVPPSLVTDINKKMRHSKRRDFEITHPCIVQI